MSHSSKIELPAPSIAGGAQTTAEFSASGGAAESLLVKQCEGQSDVRVPDFHSVAASLTSAGISVLPVTIEKRPALGGWRDFQSRIPNARELHGWFSAQNPDGLGAICGQVSGGLEVIDLDSKNDPSGTLNDSAQAAIRELAPGLWERLVIETSKSGGLHLYFRSPSPGRSHKLAHWPDAKGQLKEIAETRGEGGYVVCAPSPGYVLRQGRLESPPMLTAEERDDLLAAVRSLDRTPAQAPAEASSPPHLGGGLTPLDDFNRRGDALVLLTKHGWCIGPARPDGSLYLRRPGKSENGYSATWNYAGRRTLSVFSSNAQPFATTPTSYGPAAIYALLECGGDFRRAAAELKKLGYGQAGPVAVADPTGVRARLRSRRFDPESRPPKPQPRILLAGKPICTPGNLTTIGAQAKTGKSAFVGAIISAVICAEEGVSKADNLGLSATPPQGRALLHFDTEQSPYDADQLVRRSLRRSTTEAPPSFLDSFRLAGFSAPELKQALKITLEEADAVRGIFAVIVDGIADLVIDVNDQAECNMFIAELHELAIQYDCPIVCIVHENPAQESGKMRGHLGSQLERKAESNIRLKKSGEITLAYGEKMRGAPIGVSEGPHFTWCPIREMHVTTVTTTQTKLKVKLEKLAALAEEVFEVSGKGNLRHSELITGITSEGGISKSTAEDRFTEMKELKVVLKNPKTGLWMLNPI
jgi:hypothetical protein